MVYLDEGQEKIIKGFNKAINASKITLGAEGHYAIINEKTHPSPTKDGFKILKNIHLEDVVENIGVRLAIEIANKTVSAVDDATTTSGVIAQALINEGYDLIKSGVSHVHIREGILKAKEDVLVSLENLSKPANGKIYDIAFTSSNGDQEISKLISDAYKSIGEDIKIEVVETASKETELVITEGCKLDGGWYSPYLITNKDQLTAELINVNVLLYDGVITDFDRDLKASTDRLSSEGTSLLIVCDDISHELANSIIDNKMKRNFKICIIKNPHHGKRRLELLEDIAAFTDGKIFHPSQSNELVLGRVKKAVIGEEETLLTSFEKSSQIDEQIELLKKQLLKTPDDKYLQKRIANLSSNGATLYIGGVSTSEISERFDRSEDAVGCVRNALLNGYVAGGGQTFYHIANQLLKMKHKNAGYNLLLSAIKSPLKQILINAGLELSEKPLPKKTLLDDFIMYLRDEQATDRVFIDSSYYKLYNVRTKQLENISDTNVIDSTRVLKVALENAISVAIIILSTRAVIE